jgi:hypothetical protein
MSPSIPQFDGHATAVISFGMPSLRSALRTRKSAIISPILVSFGLVDLPRAARAADVDKPVVQPPSPR